jgi:Ni/Co efflux regulator RcnB
VSKVRLLAVVLAGAMLSLPLTAMSDDRSDRYGKGRHDHHAGKWDPRQKWDDHGKHRHHRHEGYARGHDRRAYWQHGRGHWKHDGRDWKRHDDFRRMRWDRHGYR